MDKLDFTLALGIVMSFSMLNANALTIYSQGQDPSGAYGSTHHDNSQRVADDFELTTTTVIRSLDFLGIEPYGAPATSEDNFRVNFYTRTAFSLPSNSTLVVGAAFVVGHAHRKSKTGQTVPQGQGDVNRYEIDLGHGLTLGKGEYWIEITNGVTNWFWTRGYSPDAVVAGTDVYSGQRPWRLYADNVDMSFALYDNNVPEPSAYALALLGLLGLACSRHHLV